MSQPFLLGVVPFWARFHLGRPQEGIIHNEHLQNAALLAVKQRFRLPISSPLPWPCPWKIRGSTGREPGGDEERHAEQVKTPFLASSRMRAFQPEPEQAKGRRAAFNWMRDYFGGTGHFTALVTRNVIRYSPGSTHKLKKPLQNSTDIMCHSWSARLLARPACPLSA